MWGRDKNFQVAMIYELLNRKKNISLTFFLYCSPFNYDMEAKGTPDIFTNHRFIHMEHYLPRIVESLVVNQMKDNIISKSTIYQVGGSAWPLN